MAQIKTAEQLLKDFISYCFNQGLLDKIDYDLISNNIRSYIKELKQIGEIEENIES